MRPAHSFTICALSLAWGISALPSFAAEPASAATEVKTAPAVFNPAAPTAPSTPLQHQPLATSGAIVTQPGDWKAANAAVAQFPRGHTDVLKWEKVQSATPSQAAPRLDQHNHHQHGGQP